MCQRGNGLIRNVNLNPTERRLKGPLHNGSMRDCRACVREFWKGVSKEKETSEMVKGRVEPLPSR